MAETDKIIELGREPGFFRSVFSAVYTPASSQMLHIIPYHHIYCNMVISGYGDINFCLKIQLYQTCLNPT